MKQAEAKTVTETVADLIENYQREATGPGPIWAGAAKSIVRILETNTPNEALVKLRKLRKQCRAMAVSSFYEGAANGLALAIRREKRRLEYLRGELRAERISYGELAELQGLASRIDPSDVELLQAAGVPESAPEHIGPQTAEDMANLIASGKPQLDDDGKVIVQMATCGTCGRSWNDAMITGWTPAPSARCPFEYWHLTPQQTAALAQLRSANCDILAAVTERHWRNGEAYYMDDRVNVSKRLRAAFNKANPKAE